MESSEPSVDHPLPCVECRALLPTRILADSVTLVAVGTCPTHGTMELSRVHLNIDERELTPVRRGAGRSAALEPAHRPTSYKPGIRCGLRIEGDAWCRLPRNHDGGHVG